jgi:hypothetical protein
MVNCPKAWKRHDYIDAVHDHLQDERVGQAFNVLGEVTRTIIDDEVDTDQLLERLEYNSSKGAFTGSTLEAFNVRSRAKGLFILPVALQLCKLGDNIWIIGLQSTKENQRFQGSGFIAFFDQKTRGLWEKEQASSLFPSQLWIHSDCSLPRGKAHQNYCPCELNGKRDAIASCDRVSFF